MESNARRVSGPIVFIVAIASVMFFTANSFAQTWVSTSTKAVAPALTNAVSKGLLPDSTPIHVNVGLQIQNRTALLAYVKHITATGDALYGQELEPAEFAAKYSPSSSQVQSVVSYLNASGFKNVQVEPNNLVIAADGTAASVRQAFNTQLGAFQQNGTSVYANLSAAQVPASLGSVVGAVLGLNNAARMSTPISKMAVNVPVYPGAYHPQDFWKAYDAGTTATGSKTPIAIFAEGDVSSVVKDLRLAEKSNGLSQVPVKIVQVGLASPDVAGLDEWDMDTQYSTGLAKTVSTLYLYTTTSLTDSDVALMFNHFVSQKLARAGSASFGICEFFPFLDGSMLVDDNAFLEGAAQGQTVFASSGDNGSSCGVAPTNGVPASGPPFVEYPASSSYVIGVGGTTLLTNSDGTYNNEITWNAGGGGLSQFELSPFWQSPVNPASTVGRGVPDVAMDADPESGAYVFVSGVEECCYGGTSLSSPMALGVFARLQSAHSNQLGHAGPVFYKGASPAPSPASPAGFHDIIAGTNGVFLALPGYDYTTGLGSFDIAAYNATLPATKSGTKK